MVTLELAPEMLEPEERSKLETHLGGCAGCRRELAWIQSAVQWLKNSSAPPDWNERVEAVMRRIAPPRDRTAGTPGMRIVATAAAAVLLGLVAWFLGTRTGARSQESEASPPLSLAICLNRHLEQEEEERVPMEGRAGGTTHGAQNFEEAVRELGRELGFPIRVPVAFPLLPRKPVLLRVERLGRLNVAHLTYDQFSLFESPRAQSGRTALGYRGIAKDGIVYHAFYWTDGGIAFVLLGPMRKDRLEAVALSMRN
jgi:anti-sigma factor RsiW